MLLITHPTIWTIYQEPSACLRPLARTGIDQLSVLKFMNELFVYDLHYGDIRMPASRTHRLYRLRSHHHIEHALHDLLRRAILLCSFPEHILTDSEQFGSRDD